MKPDWSLISALLLSFLLGLLAGCAPDTTPLDAAPTRPPILQVALRVTPTSTVTETPATTNSLSAATPEDVPAIAQEITRAIQANDVTQLSPLLLDAVWVAPDEDVAAGDSLSQADGLQWLKGHRGRKGSVSAVDYVRDSALLRVTTTGWAQLAPLQKGVVLFQLHRYDSSGQENDVQGNWRIDTILYQ